MPAKLIIPNETQFARLKVVRHFDRNRFGQDRYECRCDCGNTKVILGYRLKSGKAQSCGCLLLERKQKRTANKVTRKPEYPVWAQMKARCIRPTHPEYPNYGGRGIKICDEWRNSFRAFYRDVGPRPSSRHSIERINNDGNYEPQNVRWATMAEQMRNTRRTVLLTLNGETHCIADWTKILGFGRTRLHNRLKAGWSPEKALTTPIDHSMAHNVKHR